jgi:hypothetical protein
VGEVLRLVVEGVVIGAVVGALTAGAGAAVGIGAVVARVAAQSPRFAVVLGALRATTSAVAASVRSTRAAVLTQRARLDRFLGVPTRTEAGHLVLGPAPWRRGWLKGHEHSGGHTISKHVERTEERLMSRAQDLRRKRASSFRNQDEAEQIIESAIRGNANRINDWLDGKGPAVLRVTGSMKSSTGVSVTAAGEAQSVHGVRVVLVRDANMPEGFRIVTAFPQP